jgi:RimJ/RimL family protein N-acetyltransferase
VQIDLDQFFETQTLRDSSSGGYFSFRRLNLSDSETIRQWRNAQLAILRQHKPLSQASQNQYFSEVLLPSYLEQQPKMLLFAICIDNELVGYGGLVHIDWSNQRCELSFLVDSSLEHDIQSKIRVFKYFFTALRKLAFEELGLNRVFTETFDFRPDHIEMLEGFGFGLEGRLSQHIRLPTGHFCDSLFHGYLRRYWEKEMETVWQESL